MNRTLAIIMLDFFVMTSIAFFVLQFIEPNDEAEASAKANLAVFRVEISKKSFIKQMNQLRPQDAQIDSIALQDLIELGFAAHLKSQVAKSIPVEYSADNDGYTVVINSAPKDPFEFVVYIRKVKSLSFALSKPAVAILGGGLVQPEKDSVIDISRGPLVVFNMSGR